MKNHNRLFFRMICCTAVLILVVATQVTAAFNQMVQPPEPIALLQFYPADETAYRKVGILGSTFDVPVQRIKEGVQQVYAGVTAKLEDLPLDKLPVEKLPLEKFTLENLSLEKLPLEEVKKALQQAGLAATRQAELWWGEVVKVTKAKGDAERE